MLLKYNRKIKYVFANVIFLYLETLEVNYEEHAHLHFGFNEYARYYGRIPRFNKTTYFVIKTDILKERQITHTCHLF